jgi:hypothetical protein
MNKDNQGPCQSLKSAKNTVRGRVMAEFPNQELAANPKGRLGTFTTRGASTPQVSSKGVRVMLGKLAGAWLGEKVAGRNEGAKGAILGYGAAALARRSVPTLAALALGGWAFKKWRNRRSGGTDYPSDAASV